MCLHVPYACMCLRVPVCWCLLVSLVVSLLVVVVINDADATHGVRFEAPEGYQLGTVRQTDQQRDCEPIDANEPMIGKSVRTLVFER